MPMTIDDIAAHQAEPIVTPMPVKNAAKSAICKFVDGLNVKHQPINSLYKIFVLVLQS